MFHQMLPAVRRRYLRSVTALAAAGLLTVAFIGGCEENPTGPTAEDIAAAQELVDEGFVLLAGIAAGIDTMSQPPDLTTVETKFEQAARLDPNNAGAHVGLALVEMMLLSSDAEFMAAIGELLGGEPPLARGLAARLLPVGSPSLFTLGGWSPPALLARTLVADPQVPPDLEPLQTAIENTVLPLLDTVLSLLEAAEQNTEWSLTLSGVLPDTVQGGNLEIDATDVILLDAIVRGMKAGLHIFVAYNVNSPDPADTTAVKAAFNQTDGTWLVLRATGAANMGHAQASMLTMMSRMAAMQIAMAAETDDQSDDLFKIDPTGESGFTQAQLDSLGMILTQASLALSGPQVISQDFDGDGLAENLTVDLSTFFTSPVADFKQLLPPYYWHSGMQSFFWNGYLENDFTPFVFPDPTMNGVFPGLTTDAAFKAFFGVSAFPSPGPFAIGGR